MYVYSKQLILNSNRVLIVSWLLILESNWTRRRFCILQRFHEVIDCPQPVSSSQ